MLSDFQNLVNDLVRDDSDTVTPGDVDQAIGLAVSRYSKDRPYIQVEDVSAEGPHTLTLPTAWVPGFSEIQELEFPIGNFPASYINDSLLYQSPDGEEIRVADSLTVGVQVRVNFSVFHTLTDIADTVPLGDREALASYAAAALCDQLSSHYANSSDSTIQADSVDHASKSREWAGRARALRKRYFDELGVDDRRNAAAGVVVDLDMQNSQGGDRLFHKGRWR
ncbi:MAG: hypothetical protein RPU13_13875 [Candidatus Sedimenticola sp. (ex Thyasira tokunagai)]